MKLPFATYFDGFWKKMVNRTVGSGPGACGNRVKPCPFGPNLIPIAKIDINGSYSQSPLPGIDQNQRGIANFAPY